ncbi:TspO/MBR family protein [Pararhizobium sp. IMCC21322]|uniref:TspO/MBR family protein n=1 Tax=Pararhizobium sp. IMCC21322 TaxID=3067903 RepID=UPI0027405C41|nr:TspO/MBR family protein [Pararhizobium sp. IMCC21322]
MMANTISLLPRSAKSALALAGFVALCLVVGGLGALLTAPGLEPWYAGLQKPGFNPPSWIFGPVWSTLYVLMAYAVWRIWSSDPHPSLLKAGGPKSGGPKEGGPKAGKPKADRAKAYWAFAVQLLLNLCWSGAFFFLQSPGFALIVIICLLAAIVTTIVLFFRLDKLSGALFVPYVLWVCFATVLNFSIFLLN